MRHLTLYELNSMVKETIELTLDDEYWVEAELSEIRESKGHCYMELVQKDEHSNTPVAKAQAKCWRQTWAVVAPYFIRITGQVPHAGMKLLLKVYPQFHEAYGFSWIVSDIDPTYTMGDMARRRQEIIAKLKAAGIFTLNKELSLPRFTQRIAVVSSQTAAGYGDFCNHLAENEYGFVFSTRLFPAVMQGEQVEQSVIAALDRINEQLDMFDCVVIIRGGGATSDMSGFDTLALAENVANFPLPVITGIGHERDECILDMISHTRVKTPTAAAAFLISQLKKTADTIANASERIVSAALHRMEREKARIQRYADIIPRELSLMKSRQELRISNLQERLSRALAYQTGRQTTHLELLWQNLLSTTSRSLLNERHRIDMLHQRAQALNPDLLLKRGYSITTCNGMLLRDTGTVKPGDILETKLEKGIVRSVVK